MVFLFQNKTTNQTTNQTNKQKKGSIPIAQRYERKVFGAYLYVNFMRSHRLVDLRKRQASHLNIVQTWNTL
jgi:hypothetical protein